MRHWKEEKKKKCNMQMKFHFLDSITFLKQLPRLGIEGTRVRIPVSAEHLFIVVQDLEKGRSKA